MRAGGIERQHERFVRQGHLQLDAGVERLGREALGHFPDLEAQLARERVARKTSRTGRNNGGDEARRGGLNMDLTPDTLGEREGVSPAETDLIWTNDSKDRWGADQPDHAALLAQRNEIEKQRREREER